MFRPSRFALLSLAVTLIVAIEFAHPAQAGTGASGHASSNLTSTSIGQFSATFAGPAATGCDNYGCSLLTGPFFSPSTAAVAAGEQTPVSPRVGSGVF
jgi:hypothetical protein